jgi:hypothetical protein
LQTIFTTIAFGNWALEPKTFLGALKQVLEQNMPNMTDKAARMEVLMNQAKPSGSRPRFKIEGYPYAINPVQQPKKDAAEAKRLKDRADRAANRIVGNRPGEGQRKERTLM